MRFLHVSASPGINEYKGHYGNWLKGKRLCNLGGWKNCGSTQTKIFMGLLTPIELMRKFKRADRTAQPHWICFHAWGSDEMTTFVYWTLKLFVLIDFIINYEHRDHFLWLKLRICFWSFFFHYNITWTCSVENLLQILTLIEKYNFIKWLFDFYWDKLRFVVT